MVACLTPHPARADIFCVSQLNDLTRTYNPATGTIEAADSAIRVRKKLIPAVGSSTQYSLKANGSAGGGFNLSGPGGALLPYKVYWAGTNGVTSSASATQMTHNIPQTFSGAQLVPGAYTVGAACGGTANQASLIIRYESADMAAATAGTYTGVLTLLVGAP